jgi:nicotinamide riboside kinase
MKKTIQPKYKKTLVINLMAGPGAGKSTMAAALFAQLKWRGIDCELAAEYAKDLVWEKRDKTFENQVYIFGKQHNRIFRLLGQVQVVITDSPLLLTPIYDGHKRETLKKLVFEEVNRCNNLNIFVVRRKDYNPNGRVHTKSQADVIDENVKDFMKGNKVPFIEVEGTPTGIGEIVTLVDEMLRNETRRSKNR